VSGLKQIITVTMNTAIDRVLKVEGFEVGGHLQAELVSETPAGKGVNVSKTLAELWWGSTVTGFVGGEDVQTFRQCLEARSELAGTPIDEQLLPVSGKTRRNLTILDPDARTDTHLRLPGFEVTARDVSGLARVLRTLVDAESVVVFAGSRPRGMKMAGLLDLIGVAHQAGARIALDLNGADLYQALLHLNHIWLISPNRQEFYEAMSLDPDTSIGDLMRAARHLPNRVDHVLISFGGEGAALISPQQTVRGTVSIDPAKIITTIGAGDNLLAGLIYGFYEFETPEIALGWALGVASQKLVEAGPLDVDGHSPGAEYVTCEVIESV